MRVRERSLRCAVIGRMEVIMILAGTGHRPQGLDGYAPMAERKLETFVVRELAKIHAARPITHVISGMALGFDMALASAALELGIPLLAAVACIGQESPWTQPQKDKFNNLLERAGKVVIVCEGGFSAHKLQLRNEYMVRHADVLLALYSGKSGGTQNCVLYAQKLDKEIVHLWQEWSRYALTVT
jgi:uncharacterized phage-like protein YoqJ